MTTRQPALFVVLALGALVLGGCALTPKRLAGPCLSEENCDCPAPGITLRWKAAYCLATAETDDLLNAPVQKCLSDTDNEQEIESATACEQNAYWKRKVCAVSADTGHASAEACARDPRFVPAAVGAGVSSRPRD